MRLEWGPMISMRRWDVMERLAKTQPSQQLCDTAAELVQGFEEREDKRALKRVLFLLKQQGYTPTDYESESAPKRPKRTDVPVAQQISCDFHGFYYLKAAVRSGSRLRCVIVQGHDTWHFARHCFYDAPLLHLPDQKHVMRTAFPPHEVFDIDPDHCLQRIRHMLDDQTRGERAKLNGFWRKTLDSAQDAPHPASKIKPAPLSMEAQAQYMRDHRVVSRWRAGFGVDDPFWPDIHPIRWALMDEPEALAEAVTEFLLERRKEVFHQGIIEDHLIRLRDLAMHQEIVGDPDARKTMTLAAELERGGANSQYAEIMIRWTGREIDEEVGDDPVEAEIFDCLKPCGDAEEVMARSAS